MIAFAMFTVLWLAAGLSFGYLGYSVNGGVRAIGFAAIVWGLLVGILAPVPHGVLSGWEVGGIAAIHLLFFGGVGFAFGRGLKVLR